MLSKLSSCIEKSFMRFLDNGAVNYSRLDEWRSDFALRLEAEGLSYAWRHPPVKEKLRSKLGLPASLERADAMQAAHEESAHHPDEKTAYRKEIAERYQREHGWDFFMVDTRIGGQRAAPFRILTEDDIDTFSKFASRYIAWEACQNAYWSAAATEATSKILAVLGGPPSRGDSTENIAACN
jgi:hypothetical protein